jgi:hypothetical protein
MLTGRRPDTTYVGTGGSAEPGTAGWCWCERTKCASASLFMTLPTYFRRHGYVTAGGGKLFHPDACSRFDFPHAVGDDPRAWTLPYYSEANNTQIQWGSIPGPHDPIYGGDMGRSFLESPLADEDETDGMIATDAVNRLANFSGDGIGKPGANRPFFLSVGFHKPHLPHVAPKKYFDLYPINVSLAPNRFVPTGFKVGIEPPALAPRFLPSTAMHTRRAWWPSPGSNQLLVPGRHLLTSRSSHLHIRRKRTFMPTGRPNSFRTMSTLAQHSRQTTKGLRRLWTRCSAGSSAGDTLHVCHSLMPKLAGCSERSLHTVTKRTRWYSSGETTGGISATPTLGGR